MARQRVDNLFLSELNNFKDASPTSEEVCTGGEGRGHLTDTDFLRSYDQRQIEP